MTTRQRKVRVQMSSPDEPISSPGATLGRSKGPPRYNVLGVGVSALTLTQARDLVLGARGARQLGYVCVPPVHAVSEACGDPGVPEDPQRVLPDHARRR